MYPLHLRRFAIYRPQGTLYPHAFCVVPRHLIHKGQLNMQGYLDSGWASRNCAAHKTIGSHLFPDLDKPVAFAHLNRTQRAQVRRLIYRAQLQQILFS